MSRKDLNLRNGLDRSHSWPKSCFRGGTHNQPSRNVKFHRISVREYGVSIGDNPSVHGGTPISLDWEIKDEFDCEFEVYESDRELSRYDSLRDLYLPPSYRYDLLKSLGFSSYDITKAGRAAEKEMIVRQKSAREGRMKRQALVLWETVKIKGKAKTNKY